MLKELRIKNFIVIAEQTISFSRGMTAISGDSGAGKSVVLRALQFVLGEKVAKIETLLRDEALEEVVVEATFELKEALPLEWLEEAKELVIRRAVGKSGRSRLQVNGQLVTQNMLSDLASKLVLITSQAEARNLLSPAQQLLALDTYSGGLETRKLCAEQYQSWQRLQKTLDESKANAVRAGLRRAELEFVIEELSKIELREGIRGELEQQVREFQSLSQAKEKGLELCASFDGEDGPLVSLKRAASVVTDLAKLGEQFTALSERMVNVRSELAELSRDLSKVVSRISVDERSLDKMRDQLAEIARLERKYHTNDAGLIELLASAKQELAALPDQQALDALAEQAKSARSAFEKSAAQLSKLRERHVEKLSTELAGELKELGFEGSEIAINVSKLSEAGTFGFESCDIELGFKGKDKKRPLREVASGGELSRVYLALQKIMGGRSDVLTMVFDEIDTGVSGKTARTIGTKLRQLARSTQLLCITHLAQVASLADENLLVQKESSKGLPMSQIRALEGDQKLEEIARMLAGYKVTAAARESARELLSSK